MTVKEIMSFSIGGNHNVKGMNLMKFFLGATMIFLTVISFIFYYVGRKYLKNYREQKDEVLYNKGITYIKIMVLNGIVLSIIHVIIFVKYIILSM